MTDNQKPIFSFGIVADIQYADKNNDNKENRNQRYREALEKLQAAVEDWLERKEELSFILNLGDIIDGRETDELSTEDLQKVLDVFQPLDNQIPIYHVLGNHCVSLPRKVIMEKLNLKQNYYYMDVAPTWRLVVLDSTDMSVMKGNEIDSAGRKEAEEYMKSHPLDKFPNLVRWNGGLSRAQMSWFQDIMKKSQEENLNVLVALHHPLLGCPPYYPAWNAPEILEIIRQYPNIRCVFNGHYHPGAYTQENGQHYVIPEAILECPKGNFAHGVVHVYEDCIALKGKGIVTSRILKF